MVERHNKVSIVLFKNKYIVKEGKSKRYTKDELEISFDNSDEKIFGKELFDVKINLVLLINQVFKVLTIVETV